MKKNIKIFKNMKNIQDDFRLFSTSRGINGTTIDDYMKKTPKTASYIEPYILEERELNVVAMNVFSRLLHDNIIFLGTGIDTDVANIVNSQLMYLNSITDQDIRLFINSGGGSITDGMAIYDVLNFVNPDIQTYCMGMCASMAAVLLSSGTNGKRHSLPHGEIMIHQPMSGVAPGTQESDFAIAYEQLKKSKDMLYKILADNTGKSIEEIIADADRDHWLSPEEAIPGVYGSKGLIDEIIIKAKN